MSMNSGGNIRKKSLAFLILFIGMGMFYFDVVLLSNITPERFFPRILLIMRCTGPTQIGLFLFVLFYRGLFTRTTPNSPPLVFC